ncbi:hypothetical protein O6H91_06G006600 [Diphasiastrum complanatum]|nr:hypothetical protein O6H91_06G006600 [Diphasiastrum complanatum]
MAAIIGLLDILLGDEGLPTEQISMVSQIRRCSMALLRLLNNILDLSKVESGKLVLEEADFDLRHDLEGLVDMFSVQCLDHDIEIILDLADDMPEIVRGDSTRTMQIFANLVANSIKFTSSGHIIIRAQTGGSSSGMNVLGAALGKKDVHFLPSKLENEKPYSNECGQQVEKIVLWFEIDDSGCGIDPSKWDTIFESFVQADPSTTRTYGGTGLGLCIVRSLVRKMGGEIEVVKKEYAGTLIRLFLVFDHPLEMTPIPRNPHLLCFPSLLEKSRVLVAMRGKAGRSALVKWISNMGLQVLEASHWDEAITMIDELSQQDASSQTESSTDEVSAATKSESLDQHESRKHEDKKQFLKMDKFTTKIGPVEDVKILEDFASRLSVTVTSLAIIDIELFRWGTHPSAIPSATLDRFRDQGILISWLHSYNTSNSVKMELRKMGYSLMTNKPLYKSKLDSLFMSMLGLHKIGANEIHDPLLNPRFHNFHFDARDGLSPGSGMSFRLGALPSIDSFQQMGAQMNENSISGLSFQSCTDRSVDMIVEKHTSKEGRRADSNAKLSSLHERCATTSIHNNQGLDSPVHQSGNAHDVETITGSFETNSTQRNRSCGVLCNHMTDFNKDVLPGVDGSCHLNDVESVSPADIPNSLLHSAHCHPHSPLSAPTKCSVSSILELQVDQILIQLENQSAGQALLGASTCQSPLSDPDHSQQIGGYCQSRNEMSKEVISADDCSLRRPCEITSSQELGEIVSLTQNDLSGESASAYEPPPHQIINPSWRIAHQSSPVRPRKLSLKKRNVCDDLNGIHILLAEDTPVLQRVATIMLEKMGASVIVVGDGLQAVDALLDSHQNSEEQMAQSTQQQRGSTRMAALKFDLVLMDCQMPRMDGYDATIAIRNAEACTGRHIPIVALTAHAMSSDEAKCLQVGMDAYLTKPIDCKLLVMTILALTRKSN